MYMKRNDNPTIFIVEDNLLFQQLIAKELETLSDQIYFYTQGELCLKELHRNPEIIILDYNLEGEINGLDTLKEIRKFNDSIQIILFSSQKNIYNRENLLRYGSFDFLEKKRHSFGKLKKMIHSGSYSAAR
jgi:two-component system OmpR family response regulator